ncbi:hypothetical protein PFISCL1PPCAC_11565, partial [Pristionchus fissidentatus]
RLIPASSFLPLNGISFRLQYRIDGFECSRNDGNDDIIRVRRQSRTLPSPILGGSLYSCHCALQSRTSE